MTRSDSPCLQAGRQRRRPTWVTPRSWLTFYLAYDGAPKLATLSREIGWSHNLAILERCKDDLEREFYLRMTRRMGWSQRVLVQQIENRSYEQTLLGQSNFADTLPVPLRDQARLAVKDAYTFDFLELGDEHTDRVGQRRRSRRSRNRTPATPARGPAPSVALRGGTSAGTVRRPGVA
ncbi:MAG: DUF1016 domain-containing protein [bacterium]|nr:DUF1016 domain-containing protein [bacterium]